MGETILRQWLVLGMLPRPPRRIDTASIEARLRQRGVPRPSPTIQRDLLELAEVFPIVADKRAKPYGWRWADDAPAIRLPSPTRGGVAKGIEIVLRLRKSALQETLDFLGAHCGRVSDKSDDSRIATVTVLMEDSRFVRCLLLGHGEHVEVVSPIALRREITESARRILSVYGPGLE
jgi:hypothetical protein